MMASASKIKGNRYETEIVNYAKSCGVKAERARGSDGRSLGYPQEVDLLLAGFTVQAKRRKKLPKLWQQEEFDLVITREDRSESYVVMKLRDLMKLLPGYQKEGDDEQDQSDGQTP